MSRHIAFVAATVLAVCVQACGAPPDAPVPDRPLRIGFGLKSGDAGTSGVRQAARIRIRFHDRRAFDAATVREALQAQLPSYMGPAFSEISAIIAASPQSLNISMTRRSNFVLESLDASLTSPDSPDAGTGPFRLAERGADDLYEVNAEALQSLEPSSQMAICSHARNYPYVLLMNVQRPELTDPLVRRQLNDAIDRPLLIAGAMNGRGRHVESPFPPEHWAAQKGDDVPRFGYRPAPLGTRQSLTCIFADASLERMAMTVRRQLRQVGVELTLERIPIDQVPTPAPSSMTLRPSFLAWSERTRAVSACYAVPIDSGRDVLSILRQWRTADTELGA